MDNNDFIYNPRISTLAPVGPINRNKVGQGIISPLYYVFKPEGVNPEYLEFFFKTKIWHKFMKLNGDSGARSDRFNIQDSLFQEMPISFPKNSEQIKIARLLNEVSNALTLHQRLKI